MRKYFNYAKSADEEFNSLVNCTLDLARATYEGKKADNYDEKNRELLEGMGKKMVEGTKYEAEYEEKGLSLFNKPMVRNNTAVRDNFNAVIAQVTTCIVPEVVNDTFSNFIATDASTKCFATFCFSNSFSVSTCPFK